MSDTAFIKDENVLTVKPSGRLDTVTSPALEKEMQPYFGDATDIIMDFEKVEYISSSAMRVILATNNEMSRKDGSFKIINVNDKIYEIFETVGFLNMIEIDKN